MKVVADASVLIGLSSIQKLDMLHERFPEGVLVPPAVWKEVVEEGGGRPGAREVAEFDLGQTKWQVIKPSSCPG